MQILRSAQDDLMGSMQCYLSHSERSEESARKANRVGDVVVQIHRFALDDLLGSIQCYLNHSE
ncbi:MAG: hypothetical protein RI573_16835 [Balneolaceae bacterium]|nr:hypothetical protein [Balneolaceae bacterium]